MNQIEIYTKSTCPFCHRAKALLDRLGYPYIEYEISGRPELKAEMIRRSGGQTVPQVIVNGHVVGGSDELVRMVRDGEFVGLLREHNVVHSTKGGLARAA